MEQFVKQLGIPRKGYYDDKKYVIELLDSNDFSRIYSLLEESEIITLDDWAKILNTINYELTCRLKVRLPRVYTRG